MKKLLFILFGLFLYYFLSAQKSEKIFNFQDDRLRVKEHYIDSFYTDIRFQSEPLEVKKSYTISYLSEGNTKGKINLYKYFRFTGEPEDYNLIEFEMQNKKYSIKNDNGWSKFPTKEEIKDSVDFIQLDLGNKATAIIFLEHRYSCCVSNLSIFVIHNHIPRLVFNKPFLINNVTMENDKFYMELQANILEYVSGSEPIYPPELYKIWKEDDILYFSGINN